MWFHDPVVRQTVLSLCAVVLSHPDLATAQRTCLALQQPLTYRTVHEQVVSINTGVATNTIFRPIPEVAVTVSNAPTSFDELSTLRWTETRIATDPIGVSRSVPASLASPTPSSETLILVVMGGFAQRHDRRKLHDKRQTGSYYVSANGTVTNDCTTTPIYTISGSGTLTATVNGTVYTYSTSPGIPYSLFAPSTVPGSITTSFSLGSDGGLGWTNAAFWNGQASFCAMSNGTVYAVFQQNNQPDGCLFIQLSLFKVSSCQALQLSTITGPSG